MAPTQMDVARLAKVTQYLVDARRQEALRFELVHDYVKNRIVDIYVPKRATAEYNMLVDQARFNILPLLIGSLANNFFVDGYRPRRQSENARIWDQVWQPNRMDARQSGLWRSALEYGMSYATVLPGTLNGQKNAVITPWSPRRLTALYEDPINDEWPLYIMTVGTPRPEFSSGDVTMVTPVTVYDDWGKYVIQLPSSVLEVRRDESVRKQSPRVGDIGQLKAQDVHASAHNLGVCPGVRFLDTFGDLDDGPEGVVWPMLPAQRQLNQTTFGLLMAQQYSAFRQRFVTGMAIDEDENGNPIQPFNIAVDQMLQGEDPDTRFGEFSQTDLSGYLDSRDKTLLYVASARQIPPHTLVVGNAVSNISAEALAALEAGHQQDIAEHKTSFGESAEQLMRLAGKAADDDEAWADTSAEVRWRDTTPRSLAQVADALGKLATMLGVPPEALWERIPDVTDQELETWKQMRRDDDLFAKIEGAFNAQPGRRPADTPAPA